MVRVYCDFDGTVVTGDVGNALFRTFAGVRAVAIVEKYLKGTINARECLLRECEAVGTVSRDDLEAFADGFALDGGFPAFVSFCRAHEMPIVILSDGLDFYVKRILERHGFGSIPFFANKTVFSTDAELTTLSAEFPYRDEHCDQCGNCKRNHIAVQSADDDVVIYIGDGISDRCPVRYADVVFAKNDLIKNCQESNISYFEYHDFVDVRKRLERLRGRKLVKPRREAAMARRALFIAE
jgi:2-hydroxy-3-keto-5-methylthiopentenyl-1-phosphate phosphatase